jgi:hypothetical protein
MESLSKRIAISLFYSKITNNAEIHFLTVILSLHQNREQRPQELHSFQVRTLLT